jgi:hypothetical protein
VADRDLAGRRVQLREQLAVLVVGLGGLGDREDGGVLQLAGEGVGDRALVGGGGGETAVGQVVAVAEVRQDQGRVDGGDHAGDGEPAGRDDLGHGLGLDGVPQLDDGQGRPPGVRESLQLRHQVLAQGTAGTVVDERRLPRVQDAGGVPDGPYDRAGRGRRQVVVERDAAGHVGEQPGHGRPAGVGVQPADDHDGEPRRDSHGGQPFFPYRRSKRSTRPAVSRTRAVPV